MVEPEMPFACAMPDCGMTFTNEDHLNVHTKKHDMVLQFGCEQKAAVFVADQTPTPTRFIRNCEEVGLFQDLQNVNPFDEGFKRAIETKQGILSLEHACTPSSEELHTPQMFPVLDGTESVFSTTNNQRCVTISRSSSDENGAIKEFETTRISKLTNEVTTISRIVEKHEDAPKTKDTLHKNSVSYTNNIIKIHSNVEITKDIEDTVIKDGVCAKDITKDSICTEDCIYTTDSNSTKDSVMCPSKGPAFGPTKGAVYCASKDNYDRIEVDGPLIMSQKSIDSVVESLTTDFFNEKSVKAYSKDTGIKDSRHIVIKNVKSIKDTPKDIKNSKDEVSTSDEKKKEDYEVILKLPTGQQIKLTNAEETKPQNTKDLLKKVLTEKVESQKVLNNISIPIIPTVMPGIAGGTFIPVSIVNGNLIPKVPLKVFDKKAIKRKSSEEMKGNDKNDSPEKGALKLLDGSISKLPTSNRGAIIDSDSRSAASRRYRAKLKETMAQQSRENRQLKKDNERLGAEAAALKALILQHVKSCHCAEQLRELQENICRIESKN